MKFKIGVFFLLSIAFILVTVTCNMPVSGSIPALKGMVRTVGTNEPVAGAAITVAGTAATTDSKGAFTINSAGFSGDQTIVVSKSGFMQYQKIQSFSGAPERVSLFLKPLNPPVTIKPAAGGSVTTADGAAVIFPALSGITEDLFVSLTNINVKTDESLGVPGDFSAIDALGQDRFLVSLGMIDVQITGATSGNNYTLSGQGPFTIRIPVTGTCASLPATVPLWYFDTNTSKWKEEGSATLHGNYYEGTVNHFTIWNIDIPENFTGCVSINLIDTNPAPDEEYEVLVYIMDTGSYYRYRGRADEIRIYHLPRDGETTRANPVSYIQITKLSSGERWVQLINNPPTDQCLSVTAVIGDEICPNIAGLTITKGMDETTGTITFNWTTEPSQAGYMGVSISLWSMYNPGISVSAEIAKGVKIQSFTGLAEGVYQILIMPNYSGSVSSNSYLNRMCGLFAGPTRKFTADIIIFGTSDFYSCIWLKPPLAADRFQYMEPLDFPLNQTLVISKPVWYAWYGDVHQSGADSWSVTEDTISLDTDKFISVGIYPVP